MPQHPTYSLSGGNQYPAISTTTPAQYPVIAIVDAQGELITNLGNGPADGTWINMTLINGFTAGGVTPQYMINSRNVVFLRGEIIAPGGGVNICWNVPTGYKPLINALANIYFDWPNGGGNPSRAGRLSVNDLKAGYKADGTAGDAGAVGILDRMMWQA